MDQGAYVREKVTFRTTPDLRVPAYVLVPKGLSKPAPGVVALHVLSETVTLSRIIRAVPPLRWLDDLGRVRDARSEDSTST